jgi:hypothetical protein
MLSGRHCGVVASPRRLEYQAGVYNIYPNFAFSRVGVKITVRKTPSTKVT